MADDEHRGERVDIVEGEKASAPATPSAMAKAVAIEYDKDVDKTPRISATGRGALAEQILTVAFANDVKVREDAELVDVLELLDVDTPIPLEAFAAVAEILAYVYKANASMKQRRACTLHKDTKENKNSSSATESTS